MRYIKEYLKDQIIEYLRLIIEQNNSEKILNFKSFSLNINDF